MEHTSRAQIWAKLSEVEVRDYCTEAEETEDGVVLLYLPWMRAHALMMDNFPEYRWEFSEDPTGREVHYFDDGTAEVRCRMTVEGHTNITYLPVHRKGKAITNPNSMQINSAKQRARVKALGEFGLGHSMWLESVSTPAYRDDEVKSEQLSDKDQVNELWAVTVPLLKEATTQEAGLKIYKRFTRGLENSGLVDTVPKRWQAVCKKQGWNTK
jgi:hypothetical protein|tara:strand:+ start:4786 stop:5421 length:636 start_codon:yes stop_codon:yes gene_type:complete